MGMKIGVALAAVLLASGCGELAQSQQQQSAQDEARVYAEKQNRADDERRAKQREDARAEAQALAEKKQSDDDDKKAAELHERKVQEQQCDDTRTSRAAEAQARVKIYIEFVKRIRNAPPLEKVCRIEDTRGVHFEHEHDATGVTVRARDVGREDGIVCKGGLPKGLSEDDVRTALTLKPETDTGFASEGDYVDLDARCKGRDADAGLVIGVGFLDGDGIHKLRDWKPPTAN